MFLMFNILIVSAVFMFYGIVANPTQISAIDKNFRHDANFPNVHFTLLSIEDKLRKLENTLTAQCAAALDGKIDYYGRKIDNIEKDFTRFQIFIKMELENISENISSKNFKDDITKDRIIRKIDAVYERINHKLGNLEGQIDISSMKSQNGREMIISKLEKMEESLTIRDADMEVELADAVAAIDDLKTTCSNMEENIPNVTKESTKALFKANEKLLKKQHGQTLNIIESTNKTLSEGITSLYEVVDSMINQTNKNLIMVRDTKEELDENLNEYANKITNMYLDLWQKTDDEHHLLQTIEKILNLTRSEQQNGLRALMIQVGRNAGKQNDQSNSAIDNEKLDELSQKIDLNFENIMQAQNLFLESCHRVQMDEPQLETQISMVLHKVIDIFEKKTSVGPKDIEKLAHLIHTHDSNVRSNIYHITNTLLASARETTEHKDEIINYISNQKLQLETIYVLLMDILNSNDSAKIEKILQTLQGVQLQLNETNKQAKISQLQANLTSSFINQIINRSPDDVSNSNSIKLQQVLEFIKNIYHILMSMEMKINKSYLDYYFNKYNIDVVAHRFGQQLNKYIQSLEVSTMKQTHTFETGSTGKKQISDLILEIFSENWNKNQSFVGANFNNDRQDSETVISLCDKTTNASINCKKINNTVYTLTNASDITSLINNITNNTNLISTKCLPNYVDLLDVRSNDGKNMSDCNIDFGNATSVNTSQNQTGLPPVINNTAPSNNCLPNYIDSIDVRSTNEPNMLNCTDLQKFANLNETVEKIHNTSISIQNVTYLPPSMNNTAPENKCLPNYVNLIDVRNNDLSNTPNCTNVNGAVQNSSTGELNTTTEGTPTKNQTTLQPMLNNTGINNCSPNYISLIDVRNNALSNMPNCTNVNGAVRNSTTGELNTTTQITPTKNQTTLQPMLNNTGINNCSPNYINLIDVRNNDLSNMSNCTNLNGVAQNSTTDELNTTTTKDHTTLQPILNNTGINNGCLPNYINLINVRSMDGSNMTGCTNLNNSLNLNETELHNTTLSKSIQNQTNLVPTTNQTVGNKCLPNYIDLIDVRSQDRTNNSNCNDTDIPTEATVFSSAEMTESTDSEELYDIDVRYETSNATHNSVRTSLNIENSSTQKVSFIEEIATDLPKNTYNMETTERQDQTVATHIYEEQDLSQNENVDEEKYELNLPENTSTEINEYEYTNHEHR